MNNIKQITNYDDLPIEENYKVIQLPTPAIKLGYCGDTLSIGKTIILTINAKQIPFQIGETGIFEFDKYDLKNDDTEEKITVYVTEIRVPKDVPFTLDYMIQ